MGSPARREPYGDGVAVVAAGVTTCRGAEESSVQDEGRQGNRSNLMRLREMRTGQNAAQLIHDSCFFENSRQFLVVFLDE